MKKIILSLLILTNLAFSEDFEDGAKAYLNEDYEKAMKLFQKSCDSGVARGSIFIGVCMKMDKVQSKIMLKQSNSINKTCNLKDQLGCKYYKKLNSQGY